LQLRQVLHNMKYLFRDYSFVKKLFLIGASFALFWGVWHQDLPIAQS
jgi:hypothetical protein